ncbi:hypothetical protein BIV59_12860 [Bacillus sp. MUM 13]|nr:hypothetical protein BIV59_12860 [Bacillus sp. MUM 13]
MKEYISISEAVNKTDSFMDIQSFKRVLVKEGINIVPLKRYYEYQYLKIDDIKEYFEDVRINEVLKQLGITTVNFDKVIKQFGITKVFRGSRIGSVISKKDCEFLLELQQNILNELSSKTYTWNEVQEVYKQKISGNKKPHDAIMKKFVYGVEIHPIARVDKYRGKNTLYKKMEFDIYISELWIEKEITRLSDTITDYNLLFHETSKVDNICFSVNVPITQEMWFQFVDWKLKNMNANQESSVSRVTTYRNTTKLLADIIKTKEIHEFSEQELNFGIFNDNLPFSYQKEIYSFLFNITDSVEQKTGKKLFDLSKINFDTNKYEKQKKKEKEIYSVEEYLSLYNYVSDYEIHKKLAVEDVNKALENKENYKKYDSTWLYVLLHMNNGWRNGDVVNFPRFHCPIFDELHLDYIESLEDLRLTYEQAEKIVRFYQMQWFEHTKNKEKATLYCSSLLILPMAYAIIICEFRCRRLHLNEELNLINFYTKGNRVSTNSFSIFFKDYIKGFKFQSRKMNRTVLTYTSSVIESTLKGDPISIAQHLRGHVSRETTNTYIQLPKEHLDFISEQLFDTGYFGYIYKQVTHLLIGESFTNRVEQTRQSIQLRELLGDVVKLEDTTTFLKHLSQEREELGEYLGQIPQDELRSRLTLINLGLSPAKEQTYQCLFANCISNQIECSKCPFSIPHFYSLSIICKRIKRTLTSYKAIADKSDIPIGEKSKLYNLLIIDYTSVMEAKQKFGEEIIELLIDNELSDFIEELEELPDPETDLLYID